MSKVEEVKARFAKELAEAEATDLIAMHLPEGGSIHLFSLNGTIGSVSYGNNTGQIPVTWERALEIVAYRPPVPLSITRAPFTSIKPREYVDSIPEGEKTWKEECNISPVYVRLTGQRHIKNTSLEWISKIEGNRLIRVSVSVGNLPNAIGTYTISNNNHSKYSFVPESTLNDIISKDGRVLAQLGLPIRWAVPIPNVANDFTLYFVDLEDDMPSAMVGTAIVEHLAKLAKGT